MRHKNGIREDATPRYVTPAATAAKGKSASTNKGNGSSNKRNGNGGDDGSDMELTPVSETKLVVPKGRNNQKQQAKETTITEEDEEDEDEEVRPSLRRSQHFEV